MLNLDRKKWYVKYITIETLVLFLLLFPVIASNRYYIGVMINAAIFTIMVIGLNLLMGYAGQVSLGHAGFFGIGAYCSGLLNVNLGLSPWLSTLVAVIITACIAYVVGIPTLKLRGHYLAMATLGFGEIVYVILRKLDWLTKDPDGLTGIKPFSIFGLKFSSDLILRQYCIAWITALTILIISLNITRSRVGRAFRAIHGSEIAASGMGIDIARYKVQVFVVSAIYAAIAGCLYAHFHGVIGYPTFHLQTSIKLVTMVVAGGLGNIWGAILGAVILTWLPEWLTVAHSWLEAFLNALAWFPGSLKQWLLKVFVDTTVYGLLLMLVMIFMPDGLVGRISRLIAIRAPKSSPEVQMEENNQV